MHPGTLLLDQRITPSPPSSQVSRRIRAQDRSIDFRNVARASICIWTRAWGMTPWGHVFSSPVLQTQASIGQGRLGKCGLREASERSFHWAWCPMGLGPLVCQDKCGEALGSCAHSHSQRGAEFSTSWATEGTAVILLWRHTLTGGSQADIARWTVLGNLQELAKKKKKKKVSALVPL